MKNFRLDLFGIITFAAAGFCLFAELPVRHARAMGDEGPFLQMEGYLNDDRVYIGDPMMYYIKVTAPPSSEVIFSPLGEISDDVEIGGEGESLPATAGVWERRFFFRSFETGQHTLPAASATVRLPSGKEEKLSVNPLPVRVMSLLDSSQPEQDIRAIKPPRALKSSYWKLIAFLAGGIILVALLILAGRMIFRRWERIPPPPPPVPPHEIAYTELARIKNEDLPSRGRVKEYYTRVSDVVRRYLENRFRLKAPERTTEEFLVEMATTSLLSLRHQELVGDFLAHCDLVKFARYGPSEKEIEDVYDSAVRLVDETKEESVSGKP